MKRILILIYFSLIYCTSAYAQFSSISPVNYLTIESGGTQDKTQSKVFQMDGKQWAVLPTSTGTNLFRLDGSTWTQVMRLTTRKGRADCKVVGNVVHVFVYQKTISQLISIEYTPATSSFKLWSSRSTIVDFPFNETIKTGTIDVDSRNRMWLTYVRNSGVHVQWSDAPYSNWSAPITIATGMRDDDGAAIIAMPGKIGVLWSNQVTKRWGFKTHIDGSDPTAWTNDEVPASQSALNVGYGMADNHMNLKVASDGTLYCAIKTGYNNSSYPLIGLLVRRPNGSWDNLYDVSRVGTTPIMVINEEAGKLRVIYSTKTYGGDILYNESPLGTIAIGPERTLMAGDALRDPSASKQNMSDEALIIFADASVTAATGRLVRDQQAAQPVPTAPVLVSPANNAQQLSLTPTLAWQSAANATAYQLQVASDVNFNNLLYNQQLANVTSQQISGLVYGNTYYWRVRASNSSGASAWSATWGFSTMQPPTASPATPVLVSPANNATGIALTTSLQWQAASNATSYEVHVSTQSNFSNLLLNQTTGSTSVALSSLDNATAYYWRVRSINADVSSAWSSTWQFTTLTAPTGSTAQLVGHWRMDEGSGSVLQDASGLNNHATLLNPSNINWVNGMDGLSLDLPGTLRRYGEVQNNASLNMTDAITISAWIRPATQKGRVVLSKVEPNGYHLGTNGKGKLEFWFNYESNGTTYRLYSNSNINSSGKVWTHVAATFDGRTAKIFINGEEDNSVTYPQSVKIGTNNSTLLIGSLLGDNRWNGGLDDVRLYNGALTAQDIKNLKTQQDVMARTQNALAVTSIVEPASLSSLSVYPNPMRNAGQVRFTLDQATDYTLRLYDSKGALLRNISQGHATQETEQQIAVDMAGLNKGLYLIRLETKSGHVQSCKLIVE